MLYNEDNNNISNFDIILKICINNAIAALVNSFCKRFIQGSKSYLCRPIKHILCGSLLLLFCIAISELSYQIKLLCYFDAI